MARRVLLVEDDRVSRESLANLLRGLGHEVIAVWSAEEAKESLKTFTPDVALLDVWLPGLPGDAFAVYLKHLLPLVRIVFMSGQLGPVDLTQFGSEATSIPKPLDFRRLFRALE